MAFLTVVMALVFSTVMAGLATLLGTVATTTLHQLQMPGSLVTLNH